MPITREQITVTLDFENLVGKSTLDYIAFVHLKTRSGHKIMAYERHQSPVIARRRLLNLLGL